LHLQPVTSSAFVSGAVQAAKRDLAATGSKVKATSIDDKIKGRLAAKAANRQQVRIRSMQQLALQQSYCTRMK
jgi:hypothetical protein